MLLFELVASLVCLCGFAGIFAMALAIPYPANATFWSGGGSFPAVLGFILTLLALWWVVDVSLQLRKAKAPPADDEGTEKKSFLRQLIGTREQQKRLLFIMGSTLIFVFVLIPAFGRINRQFGFTVANFLFIFVTIKRFGDTTWKKTAVISILGSAIVYAVFSYVLKLPMPR